LVDSRDRLGRDIGTPGQTLRSSCLIEGVKKGRLPVVSWTTKGTARQLRVSAWFGLGSVKAELNANKD
jgi:hypothetical protein